MALRWMPCVAVVVVSLPSLHGSDGRCVAPRAMGRSVTFTRIQAWRAGCPASSTQGHRHAAREENCPQCQEVRSLGKAAPQITVTLKHLAAALSDNHDLPKKQTEGVLGDLVTLTTRHLKKGDKNPPDRPRHSPGAEACCQDGAEPCHRRGDQDQGEQEDRIPASQGTEGGGVALRLRDP